MAQHIDIKFQEKAKSQPLNKRFLDITGPYVKQGFRLQRGNMDFSVSIMRGGYTSGVAVTPSGAKIEETTDLIDRVVIRANDSVSGVPRVDSIYLRYEFGTADAVGEYVVVEGRDIPIENPNIHTHLLLGYVYVYPNNQPLRNTDFISVPYGFSSLEVAGDAFFHGDVEFDKKVVFKGEVEFANGGGAGGGENISSFIERLPVPIVPTAGQTRFTLPTTYTMNTNTLFVYVDNHLIPPSEWQEVDNRTFRFFEPLTPQNRVWAFWYRGIGLYKPADHHHDDLYYRKYEIANRSIRYTSDFFAGSTGRRVTHYLGNLNYIVISVIPVEKAANVGDISVEKRENEIIVYNTGSYRGLFDLTYIIKAPYEDEPGRNINFNDFSVESENFDSAAGVYVVVNRKRKDGTMFMKTTMLTKNTIGKYSRLREELYNTTGTAVIETRLWALSYDADGNMISKTRIT